MGDLFLLSEHQTARISPHFPLSHGVPRVDDRRVVSGIVYVIRNGLQWKDAPSGYRPPAASCGLLQRWSAASLTGCEAPRRGSRLWSRRSTTHFEEDPG
nr:transposase [Mesorhizobium camelthorni]